MKYARGIWETFHLSLSEQMGWDDCFFSSESLQNKFLCVGLFTVPVQCLGTKVWRPQVTRKEDMEFRKCFTWVTGDRTNDTLLDLQVFLFFVKVHGKGNLPHHVDRLSIGDLSPALPFGESPFQPHVKEKVRARVGCVPTRMPRPLFRNVESSHSHQR